MENIQQYEGSDFLEERVNQELEKGILYHKGQVLIISQLHTKKRIAVCHERRSKTD